VIAGLAAHGETRVHEVKHIDRGCAHFETELRALGAAITREENNAKNEETSP
jgi:UDP-N-acetylglucosamine 1-carboxyvinyltransferase